MATMSIDVSRASPGVYYTVSDAAAAVSVSGGDADTEAKLGGGIGTRDRFDLQRARRTSHSFRQRQESRCTRPWPVAAHLFNAVKIRTAQNYGWSMKRYAYDWLHVTTTIRLVSHQTVPVEESTIGPVLNVCVAKQ